jgi:hypothetical protein
MSRRPFSELKPPIVFITSTSEGVSACIPIPDAYAVCGSQRRCSTGPSNSRRRHSTLVGSALAGVLAYRLILPITVTVHRHNQVDICDRISGERRAVFAVEGLGDGRGQRPAQHRQPALRCGDPRRSGRLLMVTVAGDSVRVEYQQSLRAESLREINDRDRQLVGRRVAQVPVGVTQQLYRRDTEHLGRCGQPSGPDFGQLAGDAA